MALGGTDEEQVEAAAGMCSACFAYPDEYQRMFKATEYGHVQCLQAAIEEATTEEDRKDFVNGLEQPTGRRKDILLQRSLALQPSGSKAQSGVPKSLYKEEALYPPQKTALVIAAENGHVECVDILIQSGACVTFDDTSGRTPLMAAAENGHVKCVEVLLKEGTGKCSKTKDEEFPYVDWPQENEEEDFFINRTALIYASKNGHATCVKLLLEAEANVNLKDRDNLTALMHAAGNGHVNCVELLLKAGADLNVNDRDNMTALALATRNGHAGCVRLLQELGTTVNIDQLAFSDGDDDDDDDEMGEGNQKKSAEERSKDLMVISNGEQKGNMEDNEMIKLDEEENQEDKDNTEEKNDNPDDESVDENKAEMNRENGESEVNDNIEDESMDENEVEMNRGEESDNSDEDQRKVEITIKAGQENEEQKISADGAIVVIPRRNTRSWQKRIDDETEKEEQTSGNGNKETTVIPRRITRNWQKIIDGEKEKEQQNRKKKNVAEKKGIIEITRRITRGLKRRMDDAKQKEKKTSKVKTRGIAKMVRMITRALKKKMDGEQQKKKEQSLKEAHKAKAAITRMTTGGWKKRMDEERKTRRRFSDRIKAMKRGSEAEGDDNQDIEPMTKKARKLGSN